MSLRVFNLAEDLIWTFTLDPNRIEDLLNDPQAFIRSQQGNNFTLSNVLFDANNEPNVEITIQFLYGTQDSLNFEVQGVYRTSLIIVRCPSISALSIIANNDHALEANLAQIDIASSQIHFKRQESPRIGFSHLDFANREGQGNSTLAQFIRNPALLPFYLNRQTPAEVNLVVKPNGDLEEDELPFRFALTTNVDSFRIIYQYQPSASNPLLSTPSQICGKKSGTYQIIDGQVVLFIDELHQSLWAAADPIDDKPDMLR